MAHKKSNWDPTKAAPATEAAPAWNEIDFILKFEEGNVSEEELIEGFQHLIDNGHAWTLQGIYGRTAHDLIVAGKCHPRTGGRYNAG